MCYSITLAGALISTFAWQKNKSKNLLWLNLMLYGGAMFGVIDHLLNGELFLVKNLAKDLAVGLAITVSIFICWLVIVKKSKINGVKKLLISE